MSTTSGAMSTHADNAGQPVLHTEDGASTSWPKLQGFGHDYKDHACEGDKIPDVSTQDQGHGSFLG